MKRIGILGAGTWGMALARMLTVSGNDVLVWSAIEKEIDDLSTTRVHPNLPQMKIPEELRFTKSIEEVCKDKDILLFAVPSVFVRSTAAKARPYVADGQIIVDVAKGIEPDTLYTMTEILADELGRSEVLSDGEVELVYEDQCLNAGNLSSQEVSPMACLPQLMSALRDGWLLEESEEDWQETSCFRLTVDQTGEQNGKILSTLWLRQEDGTPLRGEIAVDGEIILTADFTSFSFYDTIENQE